MSSVKLRILFYGIFLTMPLYGWGQPVGTAITLRSDTPTYAEAGMKIINPTAPLVLAKTMGEDREPKVAILPNGNTVVFWVNRNGSHHVSGMDAQGNPLLSTFETDIDTDIIVGVNTGLNTNWTLCKADPLSGNFLAAATFLADTISGSLAEIPASVTDVQGRTTDNENGHGFFRLFDPTLQPVTPPISISQFTTGHREWDCCWLNDGKFVIGAVSLGHQYIEDPDWDTGINSVATLNIFNADGTRFRDEFFLGDLTGKQNNVWLGTLNNGFVCVYEDDDSRVGGSDLYRGILFDNEGNILQEFVVTDEANLIQPVWMDAGGGDQFVTVHEVNVTAELGLPDVLLGMPVVLAQRWSNQGERIGPYVLVSQHDDYRSVSRSRCAMARNGSFLCAWIDNGADTVQFTDSVIARLFSANGMPAVDAFVAHPLPEFEETLGGDASEPMPAIVNNQTAVVWATRAAPDGYFRDIALMGYTNPATEVGTWELY